MMNLKRLLPVLVIPTLILMLPLGAMLGRVEGWAWSAADFLAAWVLMAGVGMTYLLLTRRAAESAYRSATGLALLAAFLLIWINGAVGFIGSEDNPANLLYSGVLVVGLIGAVLARLEPRGMAWALAATASAQFLVPVLALIVWRPAFSPGVVQVFVLNFVFVLLFLMAAGLFAKAEPRRVAGAGTDRRLKGACPQSDTTDRREIDCGSSPKGERSSSTVRREGVKEES